MTETLFLSQGFSKSDYYSILTVQVGSGHSQQLVFSGSGGSVQEAHDAAATACLLQDLQNPKMAPYNEMMHFNAMPNHTPSAPELLGGPPV